MAELRVRPASIVEYVVDGTAAGLIVLAEHHGETGKDLLVVAMVGDHPNFFKDGDDFIAKAAREGGYAGRRCYTARPGLVKRLEAMGWRRTGVEMRSAG